MRMIKNLDYSNNTHTHTHGQENKNFEIIDESVVKIDRFSFLVLLLKQLAIALKRNPSCA